MLFSYFLSISKSFPLYLGMIFENISVFASDRLASLQWGGLFEFSGEDVHGMDACSYPPI